MVRKSENLKKVCSFYVSDWHFITMLLPYINKAINEETKITTILESDTQNKVETLLNNLKLKNTEKILNIDWSKKELSNININKLINNQEIEIIVSGSEEYISKVNKMIEKYMEKENSKEVKIINCYYADSKLNIKEILQEHEMVLNTAGEKDVKEFLEEIKAV